MKNSIAFVTNRGNILLLHEKSYIVKPNGTLDFSYIKSPAQVTSNCKYRTPYIVNFAFTV